MSRVGSKAVTVPDSVTVSISGRTISVEGPKGKLQIEHRPEVEVSWDADEKQVRVRRHKDTRAAKAFHGMTRALVHNMVTGVSEGFSRVLEISGVGWNASVSGNTLSLNIGYSDTRRLTIPKDLDVNVDGNRITISGADKQSVGQFAAVVRGQRPPEPYNGKGLMYADEKIVRKEGKAFAGR